ncbi:MAG: DUF4445 domain-containing protein [Chitinivibrionales bacterium]|nr:DUF4445 domain-containing protein [Chitinivibrionales bacterium]
MTSYAVTFIPSKTTVRVDEGATLLEAAVEAGIMLNAVCGGNGTCGKCKVTILPHKDATAGRVVLACITKVFGDCIVDVGKSVIDDDGHAGSEQARPGREDGFEHFTPRECNPLVTVHNLALEEPSLDNNDDDWSRFAQALQSVVAPGKFQAGLEIIQVLPPLIRGGENRISAVAAYNLDHWDILSVDAEKTLKSCYAVAVDIGTTTVVANLIDLITGEVIDGAAVFNSQDIHGQEVTARLISAERKGIGTLQDNIAGDINKLIGGLADANAVAVDNIYAVVIAGNTAMEHFLLALPVENIRREPYIAACLKPPAVAAHSVGVGINHHGYLYCLPGISSWVGSDLTAGIFATGMHTSDEISLLVDIGTNGEVIIGSKDWLIACSASAGPALEGASVECGMRATAGAVERVFAENDSITYSCIGDCKPAGICGSGIIDLIAVLLKEGVINRSGKIVGEDTERIRSKEGIQRYVLVPPGESSREEGVFITEVDIENIITAKAAIYAAIHIITSRLDLSCSDIDRFYIAGSFGRYLDIGNAVAIGLLPPVALEKVRFAGNTSLKGASMAALSIEAWEAIRAIAEKTTYYDLMGADDYVEEFQKAMFLPHTDIEVFAYDK